MLMNVVLPAPLVPISPTTESFSIAAFTSEAAITAPKLLCSPLALRTTGMAGKDGPDPFGEKDDQQQQRDAEAHLPGIGRKVERRGVDGAVEEGAGEGRDHVAGSGEDRDEDEFAGGRPVRHLRVDVAHRGGGKRAADAGERGGNDVPHVHRIARGGAHVLDADLVVLDGRGEPPEWCAEV